MNSKREEYTIQRAKKARENTLYWQAQSRLLVTGHAGCHAGRDQALPSSFYGNQLWQGLWESFLKSSHLAKIPGRGVFGLKDYAFVKGSANFQ